MNKIELRSLYKKEEAEVFTKTSLNQCKFRTLQFHGDICR